MITIVLICRGGQYYHFNQLFDKYKLRCNDNWFFVSCICLLLHSLVFDICSLISLCPKSCDISPVFLFYWGNLFFSTTPTMLFARLHSESVVFLCVLLNVSAICLLCASVFEQDATFSLLQGAPFQHFTSSLQNDIVKLLLPHKHILVHQKYGADQIASNSQKIWCTGRCIHF